MLILLYKMWSIFIERNNIYVHQSLRQCANFSFEIVVPSDGICRDINKTMKMQ